MNFDLETIGKFVGTYGLAVFLVLYYAVRLYPEMQKERGEWIKQITRLRQLVDPISRPLTREQAKTVMQITSDGFADRLQLGLQGRVEQTRSWIETEVPGLETVRLFGQELSFSLEAKMGQDERDKELAKLIKDAQRLLEDQKRQYRDMLADGFTDASESGRRNAYRLALLRFGNTNLEEVWRKALDQTNDEWHNNFSTGLTPYDRYDVERVRQFFSKHPSYSLSADSVDPIFAKIRFVSAQEFAGYLKTVFDRNAEAELRRIEESVEETV
jgi:hypothetical protein